MRTEIKNDLKNIHKECRYILVLKLLKRVRSVAPKDDIKLHRLLIKMLNHIAKVN